MLISIIIVVLNQHRFIAKAVESVLNQSYGGIEIIVVDGGSTDGTYETLLQYKDKMDVLIHEKDRGQAEAINKGLRLASGDVIGYLCGDDELVENTVELIVEGFTNEETSIVTGNALIVDQWGRGDQVSTPRLPSKLSDWVYRRSSGGAKVIQPSTFWRASVHSLIGYFDEAYHYSFDYDFFLRAKIRGCQYAHINQVISRYRLHEDSKTVSNQGAFIIEDYSIARKYKMYGDFLDFRRCLQIRLLYSKALLHKVTEQGRFSKMDMTRIMLIYPNLFFYRYTYRLLLTYMQNAMGKNAAG